jgi:hypothetical protein
MQMREQQFEPPFGQGLPSWRHPPAPPPVTKSQRPALVAEPVQAWPQHWSLLVQMSPLARQEEACAQILP